MEEREQRGGTSSEEASEHLMLLTGDTLFPQSCGRTDLAESSAADMKASLTKLSLMDDLKDSLLIYPGIYLLLFYTNTIYCAQFTYRYLSCLLCGIVGA